MLVLTKAFLFSRRRTTTILALTLAGILLFNRIHAKGTSSAVHAPPVVTKLEDSNSGNDVNTARASKIEITGYWKEVRASLGLPPLSGVITTPMNESTTNTRRVSRGSGSNEDERYLRRMGRFSPTLRRRRQLSTFANDFHEQEGEDERKVDPVHDAASAKLGLQPERMRGAERVPADLDSDSQASSSRSSVISVSSPGVFPDLFIAPEADETPRTPAKALAASFRAIAVRELKNKRKSGRAHDRRRKQILR